MLACKFAAKLIKLYSLCPLKFAILWLSFMCIFSINIMSFLHTFSAFCVLEFCEFVIFSVAFNNKMSFGHTTVKSCLEVVIFMSRGCKMCYGDGWDRVWKLILLIVSYFLNPKTHESFHIIQRKLQEPPASSKWLMAGLRMTLNVHLHIFNWISIIALNSTLPKSSVNPKITL